MTTDDEESPSVPVIETDMTMFLRSERNKTQSRDIGSENMIAEQLTLMTEQLALQTLALPWLLDRKYGDLWIKARCLSRPTPLLQRSRKLRSL